MISRYFAQRIMSTRLPPHVELMREETLKTLSGTSSIAVVRGEAADLRLLAEGEHVGLDAHLLPAPHRAGQPDARLDLVEDQQELELVGEARAGAGRAPGRKWLSPPSPWIGSRISAAMSSGLAAHGGADLPLDGLLGGRHVAEDLLGDREREARAGEARPVELREVLGLARVGRVRHRERVARPAVEGVLEVEDLRALLALAPRPGSCGSSSRRRSSACSRSRACRPRRRTCGPSGTPEPRASRTSRRSGRSARCRCRSWRAWSARPPGAPPGTPGPASSGGCSRPGASRSRRRSRGSAGRSGRRRGRSRGCAPCP